jgi:adenylate cyclase
MDRIWQWAWDRYGPRYSWAMCAVIFLASAPIYLLPVALVVAFERSSHYVEAVALMLATLPVVGCLAVRPGLGAAGVIERWAAGGEIDRASALAATYSWSRGAFVRPMTASAVWAAATFAIVGAVAGAPGSRLIQYSILGAAFAAGFPMIGLHSVVESAMRPVRVEIAGDTAIGDSLPRSRPSFATWSNMSILAVVFVYTVTGAMLATVFDRAREMPVLTALIGVALTLAFGVPITVGVAFAPSLRPVRDLAEGTERVAAGDYSQRLPVVQDDDLGALSASFNRMQAGLAERQRLQVAFGTYVDPALAARLLEQGDDIFTGERREVSVMFVDIRDFTPFAEANTAEDTVTRLNALFEIVVPAVVDAGGHVNKFLGDGALAVFGAPNDLAGHSDAAVSAAVRIHRLVTQRFGDELRIGTGINTGTVIAGTIGGAGKLEFTLIGDTVNVAARVEQLTKTTGDAILLTGQCVDGLVTRPIGLTDRGSHALKGKSAVVQVFALNPA